MPVRLAFLSSWVLTPEKGSGTAMAISGLATELERLGCRVDLIGVDRILRGRPGPWRPGHLPTRLAYNAALPLRLEPSGYDAVIGFDLDGCLMGRSHTAGTPLQAVSLKGVAADERRFETGLSGALFTLIAGLEARNVRRAERVLVTSEYCRERATELYGVPPERLRIVPEGIDLASWERSAARAREREEECRRARPDRGGPVLLNVARQYRRKDTRTLLDALPAVLRKHPDATLRIVGGGPELPALRRRARQLGLNGAGSGDRADRVVFRGEVPGAEEVRRELRDADVFCLPSRQEGFGIALLEAMAAGTPIVATAAGAIPEVVGARAGGAGGEESREGAAGLLVPPGDSGALAGALRRLLGDRELQRRLRAAGRSRVRRYAWPEVAGRFLDALDCG